MPQHSRRPQLPRLVLRPSAAAPRSGDGWDQVATWYDKLVGDDGSDYHKQIILPAVLKLLSSKANERVLDLCCGQGVLARLLIDQKLVGEVVGVDASPKLIEAARERTVGSKARYFIADVCTNASWADGRFDAAACVMAVHDLERIDKLFMHLAQALKPGGRAVIVMMHPCFRIPRQTHWGWDEEKKIQYRRLDRYSVPLSIPVTTHPGRGTGEQTWFYHRPLSAYMNALGEAGLSITQCEELHSHRRSQAGPRSRGEHRAAEEFPLFMALVAVKQPVPVTPA